MAHHSTPVRDLRTSHEISTRPQISLATNGFSPWRATSEPPTVVLARLALARMGERGPDGWHPATSVPMSQRTFARLAHTTRARVRKVVTHLGATVTKTGGSRLTEWTVGERPQSGWTALSRPALDEVVEIFQLDSHLRRGERTEREAALALVVHLACEGGEVRTTLASIASICGMATSRMRRAVRAAVAAGLVAAEAIPGVGYVLRLLVTIVDAQVEQNRSLPGSYRRLGELLAAADADLADADLWSRGNRRLVATLLKRGVRLERIAELISNDGPLSTARRPAAALHARLRRLVAEPVSVSSRVGPLPPLSPLAEAALAARDALAAETDHARTVASPLPVLERLRAIRSRTERSTD